LLQRKYPNFFVFRRHSDLRLSFAEGVDEKLSQLIITDDGQPIAIQSVETDPTEKNI
jgi:hypothetical protein